MILAATLAVLSGPSVLLAYIAYRYLKSWGWVDRIVFISTMLVAGGEAGFLGAWLVGVAT